MKTRLKLQYRELISIENLLAAWQEFVRGKKKKSDVQEFDRNLAENILNLYSDLFGKIYRHGGYHCFKISDPKPRDISKASVRDQLVHHAIYRILYPFFDKTFVADSYSCRLNKGTHRAVDKFKQMFYQVSKNNTRTCWVLKLDIKKFFASIDHEILIHILKKYIPDQDVLWLLGNIIDSFDKYSTTTKQWSICTGGHKGLPLGNLTSQLFVNIYMNEFDQFVKHRLKVKYYIRYADDFIILSHRKNTLTAIRERIAVFLQDELRLNLHPGKIVFKTFASGVDFLGWVNFVHHKVLRTATKRRMFRRLKEHSTPETVQSYLGLLSHGNTNKLRENLLNNHWINTGLDG